MQKYLKNYIYASVRYIKLCFFRETLHIKIKSSNFAPLFRLAKVGVGRISQHKRRSFTVQCDGELIHNLI